MVSKLTQITNGYHTFVENQVLTEKELNEFVSYFDDQDRLSRVFLHGVGLVCGFKLSFTGSSLTVSQGVGLTTDGDLIQLKEPVDKSKDKTLVEDSLTFTRYRKFKDDNAFYQPFRKFVKSKAYEQTVFDLYELLPEGTENTTALNELPGLKNMTVFLYLESYANQGDLCTAIDCDNQGIEEINRLKVLLISKPDAETIAGNDDVFSIHNVFDAYFALPQVALKRVVLNGTNTSKYELLKAAYTDAIRSDDLLTNLKSGITSLVENFGDLLQIDFSEADLTLLTKRLNSLFSYKTLSEPFDIQYRYDLLKDLVDTYNELQNLLLDIRQLCLPDITAFPKHLMLGLLSEIHTEPKHLRHHFYPAATAGCEIRERAASLLLKMFELINTYGVKSGDILITPSNKLPDLSKRSIPFYYQPDASFLKAWEYDKTRISRQTHQLCYHRTSMADLLQFQDPLNYNTDRFDFYRIEGHQGKNYVDVLKELEIQKTKYGLSFDVKVLSVNINSETINIDDYECEFEDLKVLLEAWTAEQDCILAQVSSFFSGFSTRLPGANIREAELDLKSAASVSNLRISTNLNAVTETSTVVSETTSRISAGRATKLLYQTVSAGSVVSDNMSTVEDTLGVEMKAAIEETKGGSANDIIASATMKLKDKLSAQEWTDAPDLKDFVANKSVELMAHTYILTQRMPLAVSLVDRLKVNDYKLSLTQLCSRVQKLKAAYQSNSLKTGLQAYIGLLINQLATVCCSGKKLEILLEEINARKDQILLRLQLSEFIKQHPGLEHRAGVEPGGTFVLVYKNAEVVSDNQSITDKLTASNSLLSSVELSTAKTLLSNQILNADKLTVSERTTVLKSTAELLNYEDYLARIKGIESIEKLIAARVVPDNTVVADFALPYMCCSDCAPINFIIAKSPVTLRLERDKYCLLTHTDPILYQVSPADGVVQTNPTVAGISVENGKLVILADAFPEEMLGNAIHFTVNQQVTDAVLTVCQGVIADFEVPSEPTEQTSFAFKAFGQNLDGASYLWDFGDGSTSQETSPKHTYKLPVNNENKVTVSLTVTAANGICKTTTEHDITFVEIKPSIDLTPKEFCENDEKSYLFTITPAGAKVEISGPGVVLSNDGVYNFIPAASNLGTVKFILNGEDAGISVNVVAAPQAACSPKQVGNQLVITNTSKNAVKFIWDINGKQIETDNLDPVTISLTLNSPTEWKIILTAVGADVCRVSLATVTVTTKYIEETPVNTCIEDATVLIRMDAKRLAEIKPDADGLITKILTRTQQLYGGTSEFNKGVLDELERFLNGDANDRLEELFYSLLKDTGVMIVEMNGNAAIQQQFILLFELQLRLFYLVLGCQKAEVIDKFADLIQSILKQIIEILMTLKEWKVVFSDTMKSFIESYAKKVSEIKILVTHIKTIIDQKLI